MARTIVILGAGYAGLPIAHYLLKYTAAKLKDLKVIVVAPNTHFYWNIASVRGILPDIIADDQIFIPIAPAFAKYPSDWYELVLGVAERVDAEGNTVHVRGNDGSARTIQYDELVIATGSGFGNGMPFKNLTSTDATKDALHDWARHIKAAKSIVVGGGGATGIEVAGELGQEYGVTGQKTITLVCDDDLPLQPKYKRNVRETAKTELEKLTVKVITNAKVAAATSGFSSSESPSSTTTTTITLTPTTTTTTTTLLQADLFIPAYGLRPNTAFLPASMLDPRGLVKQTTRLRAEGHDNIFVVGDAGNLEDPQAVHTDAQVTHAAKLLEARLLRRQLEEGDAGAGSEYKPDPKVMFVATLGRNKGTGQMGGWRIWGFVVSWVKGRTLLAERAAAVARGDKTGMGKDW